MNRGPDFIGIGAQKAGTSWLYTRLSEMPEFQLVPKKELHYFDRNRRYMSPNLLADDNLLNRFSNEEWRTKGFRAFVKLILKRRFSHLSWYWNHYMANRYSDEWYLSLFDSLRGVKGEITPAYSMLEEEDIRRMKDLVPEAKLIFLLRNPVDRAWSHFRFDHPKLIGKDVTEAEITRIAMDFFQSEGFKKRAEYVETIRKYSHLFKGQLLIGFYDAVKLDPIGLLKEITEFLGVACDVEKYCKVNKAINVSKKSKIPETVRKYLEDYYRNMMQQLSDDLGGYATNWYNSIYGNGTEIQSPKSTLLI